MRSAVRTQGIDNGKPPVGSFRRYFRAYEYDPDDGKRWRSLKGCYLIRIEWPFLMVRVSRRNIICRGIQTEFFLIYFCCQISLFKDFICPQQSQILLTINKTYYISYHSFINFLFKLSIAP